jgi:hypothetical protein
MVLSAWADLTSFVLAVAVAAVAVVALWVAHIPLSKDSETVTAEGVADSEVCSCPLMTFWVAAVLAVLTA